MDWTQGAPRARFQAVFIGDGFAITGFIYFLLSKFFEVIPLSGLDLSIAAVAGVIVFVVMELRKKFQK